MSLSLSECNSEITSQISIIYKKRNANNQQTQRKIFKPAISKKKKEEEENVHENDNDKIGQKTVNRDTNVGKAL